MLALTAARSSKLWQCAAGIPSFKYSKCVRRADAGSGRHHPVAHAHAHVAARTALPLHLPRQPVLLLALEDYFNEPLPTVLKRLYEAINSIDISHAPRFSPDEKIVLRNSERKDLFGEKFHFPEDASHGVGHAAPGAGDGQYDASARSQTPTPANTSNVVPGHGQGLGLESGIPELAIRPTSSASVLNYTDELAKPRTRVVSGSSLGRPGTSGSGSGQRQQPLPMQRSLSRSKELRDTHFFDTHVAYNGLSLPIRLPLATFQHEVGDVGLPVPACIAHPPVAHALTLCLPHDSTLSSRSFRPSPTLLALSGPCTRTCTRMERSHRQS